MSSPEIVCAASAAAARLEQRAHAVEVHQVVTVERAHDRAAVRLDLDQALRLELQQRLADRRARGAEALCERLRPQPLPRLQDPFEDRVLQLVAHADGARLGHLAYEIMLSEPFATRAGPDCMQQRLSAASAAGSTARARGGSGSRRSDHSLGRSLAGRGSFQPGPSMVERRHGVHTARGGSCTGG